MSPRTSVSFPGVEPTAASFSRQRFNMALELSNPVTSTPDMAIGIASRPVPHPNSSVLPPKRTAWPT